MEATVVLRDLFEGLTRLDRNAAPIPGAAASWTTSDDGLVYTFRLRPNLKWSNGDPVVRRGLRRGPAPAGEPRHRVAVRTGRSTSFVNAGDIVAGKKPVDSLGVAAPGRRHRGHHARHAGALSTGSPGAFPPARRCIAPSLAKLGDRFARAGEQVSNGAFVLAEWLQGSYIRAARNPALLEQRRQPHRRREVPADRG